MAVFRPKRNGVMSKVYVCEFILHERRIQETTGSTSKTIAKEYEKRRRAELERAAAGLPVEEKAPRLRSVSEVTNSYLEAYRLTHRPASIVFAEARLKRINASLGSRLLAEVTEECVCLYMRQRKQAGVSGRTINMEVGELSRAIGRTWRELWPKVRKFEERKDVGRALSISEQSTLLAGLDSIQSQALRTLVPTLLLTGMRSGEATSLHWSQVDLFKNLITVGRAKTSSGTGRIIPIHPELARVLNLHRDWFVSKFGGAQQKQFVFPFGHPVPSDPSRHITDVRWAWNQLRRATGVNCRLHDLRHTFATGLAENGASESTMLSLMGQMSRAMLERYSHIRMAAKVEAVSGLTLPMNTPTLRAVPVILPVADCREAP